MSKSKIDQTRQPVYVYRNIETRSCNHCCSGKAVSITYFDCVFVALGIQHGMGLLHIFLSPRERIFPHYLTKGTILEKTLLDKKNASFDFLYNFYMKRFSF